MVTIQEKALQYAKKNGGCFLIHNRKDTVCCCSGKQVSANCLSVDLVQRVEDTADYDAYTVEGVNVYIENNLIQKEQISVHMLPRLPFMKPMFSVKGVEQRF